ncbi:protein SRG1-like [Rosa rugosa]|uniref:protein SRG1-like n=1 Tax=Rosa rugosa TaxID=74645 RepID=UPI002B402EA5|nr:protein SRG1-like [Rosa rugosa]
MARLDDDNDSVKLCMSVQEMSINGDEPPPEYIVREGIFGAIDSSPEIGQIPIIDINLYSTSSHDSEQAENELEKLRSALSSSGCFQAIGHGISSSFLDKLREAATQFFALPEEEKQKNPLEEKQKHFKVAHRTEGYGHDVKVSEEQVLDWAYRLTLRVFPEDQRCLDLWPENPNNFGEVLREYATKVRSMMGVLFKAMAKSLNLEENSFANQLFGEQALMTARFNFYPQCSRADQVLGVKPHTDGSGITVLLQDKEVEGLQILVEGKWVKVPIVPHAIVVNLGDQMQIMSNGIFKSPMHRVVTNFERMRLSVALFNEPDPEIEISPVEELIDEMRPRVYKNVKNYGRINYECYQRGEIALETMKI